ncbi:MAG: thiol-disulfide isomerase [Vicinamibacterales bacterium]
MRRGVTVAAFVGVAALLAAAMDLTAAPQAPATQATAGVTFTKDVAPILYRRCVDCHRPNEMAPMSLRTYGEVRPWARSIRQRVIAREMPPWFADPAHGQFANDARLPDAEVETIARWVDAGAPKGDEQDLPPLPAFTDGWTIGEPDLVLSIPEHEVPAQGVVPYTYFTVPTSFTEDQWIAGLEIRPGNRQVVHHVIVSVLEPGVEGPPQGATGARVDVIRSQLGGITPNKPGFMFREGTGKLVKAGSKLVFQMHYTPFGEAVTDRTTIGLKLAKKTPLTPVRTGMTINARFVIPPGEPAHEVRAETTIAEDIHVVSLTPHMHFRGKDFTYTATYPDGRREILLRVANYDFNWQLTYWLKTPLALPKGTRLEGIAHFDNSSRNPANPDPKAEVRWGDQTFEEMMIGFYAYTRDVDQATTRPTGSATNADGEEQ